MELGKALRRQLLDEIVRNTLDRLTHTERLGLDRRIREYPMPGFRKGRPPLGIVIRTVVQNEREKELLRIVAPSFVRECLPECEGLQKLSIDASESLDDATKLAAAQLPEKDPGILRLALAVRAITGRHDFRVLVDDARSSLPVERAAVPHAETTDVPPSPIDLRLPPLATLEELATDLEVLQSRLSVESAWLLQVASGMADGNLIVDDAVPTRLHGLVAACRAALQMAADLHIPLPALGADVSVKQLAHLVGEAVNVRQKSEFAALVSSIARLDARTDESRAALREVQEESKLLTGDVTGAGPRRAGLVHASQALVQFVKDEFTTDAECEAAFHAVESVFGRSVAIAASRGQYFWLATASTNTGASDNQAPLATLPLDAEPDTHVENLEPEVAIDEWPTMEVAIVPAGAQPVADISPQVVVVELTKSVVGPVPQVDAAMLSAVDSPPLRPPESARRSQPRASSRPAGALGAQELAQQCLVGPRPDLERDLVWALLAENRAVFAAQLVRTLPSVFDDSMKGALDALLLSPLVSADHSEATPPMAAALGAAVNIEFESEEPQSQIALAALAFCASACPSLVAPSTSASAVLRAIRPPAGLESLFELCRSLADVSDEIHGLDAATLASLRDHSTREAELLVLRDRATEWFIKAPTHTINFAPATHVWQAWSKDGGLLHNLVLSVLRNDVSRLDQVQHDIARLRDQSTLEQDVNRTFLDLKRGGKRIHGDALAQFRRHAIETLDLVDDWTKTVAARPEVHDYQRRQAESARRLTLEDVPRVQLDIERFAKSHRTPATACARTLFADASRQMVALFKTGRAQSARAPNEVLTEDLLRIDEISLDEYWEILDYEPTRVRRALLHAIADGPASWTESLDARNRRFDHRSSARIIARADVSPEARGALLQERAMRVQECQAAVEGRVSELSRAVEEAVAFGLLRGDERLNLDGTLEKLKASIVDDADFGQLLGLCDKVKTRLVTLREEAVSEVRARVSKYGPIDESARSRIVALLNRGDILTANEYLVMVQTGQQLPAAGTQRDRLVDFFVEQDSEGKTKAQQLDEYLQKTVSNQTIKMVAQRKAAGPLDFHAFSEDEAEAASAMLEAWFTIKRPGAVTDATVLALLEQLGFRPISVSQKSEHSFEVVTEGLSDRSICPVPQLGSLAKGRYRLILLRSRPLPSDEDILRTYGVSPSAVPPIVFYFGKLSEPRRRALALLCRERRQALVMVDDTLALYLASASDGRLATLLDCTLPFTLQMPFTTTAGLVPVEMFYGRRFECEELMSTTGSSFIFGGRQLGKTALLRHVEREFHRPSEGQVAQWMDLKTIGLGFDLPLEELWARLALELKKWNVLPKGFPEHANPEKVLNGIATWLDESPGRRVLFLLDEADQFLETDAKNNFRICDQLKSLMDRTERRFKVVFAGLHNVQRTTRSVNHPLAHFGRAICVGPLLDSEAREARALIERPLGVLGYRFESPDLVTRILSQTNYYPSLIQLYCLHLLRHVCDHTKSQFAPSTSPPYVITSRHIDEAYRSRDLRQAISERFKLTLQLDSRYEVLAYAFAHAVVVEKRPEVLDGATPEWFRENAVPWWSEGFAVGGTDNESLRCLLDEMVGLGVFRIAGANHYALRSPNVAVLLGTEHEIRDGLYNENRTLPVEYAPDTFRRKLAADDPQRSPFTALQESDLRARTNGVSVAFGCGAAGLDQVGTFLRASFGPEYTLDWSDVGDAAALRQHLDALENRPRDGVTLALVPNTVPWTSSWVMEARRRVERLKSPKSFVRVLFVSDPAKTWQLAGDEAWLARSDDVATLTLRPWRPAALQQWLIDCGFPHDAAAQEDALSTTGGWSTLLLDYYEHVAPKPSEYGAAAKRLIEANREPERARAMAALFGLGDVRPEARLALELLAQVGPASEGDLVSLDSRCERYWAAMGLSWASALGLATPLDHRPAASSGGDLQWRLDGAVAQILSDLPGA